jgi:hypothetical protein
MSVETADGEEAQFASKKTAERLKTTKNKLRSIE